jgi:hypothetical protein
VIAEQNIISILRLGEDRNASSFKEKAYTLTWYFYRSRQYLLSIP